MAESLDAVILRTPVRNAVMSVWCPDRLRRPAIEWVQETFCLRVNGLGREADLSPTVMSTWSFIFLFHTFPCMVMSWNVLRTRVAT